VLREHIKNPKLMASFLVSDVLRKSLFLNEMLTRSLGNFSIKERRFITEIVYGTIRHLKHIDFWIEQAFKKKLSKIEPGVLSIIRIAIYQTLFMNNRPDWSVTYEAAELVKKSNNKKSAGFVNFILREIQRIGPTKEKLLELTDGNIEEFNKVYYSYPDWLYKTILEKVGPKIIDRYLNLANIPLGITLRVEGENNERDEIIKFLEDQGVDAEKSEISSYGIYTHKAVNYDMLKDFKHVFIQDESSQLAVLDMDIVKGETILDLCAAPGGKSFFLSYLTGEKGKVISADINRYKLQMIAESVIKHGIKNIEIKLQDAAVYRDEWSDNFSKVLVDAPCSALGTVRRHPEIKWLKKEKDIHRMAGLAANVLKTGSKYVKKNGILLFAVCTYTREETTDQIQKFIKNNNNFKVEKAYYTINSDHDQRDSFFIAKLRRIR